MENKIRVVDQLDEVSRSLTGVLQLLRHSYDSQNRQGFDAEYLAVLEDTIYKCNDTLISIKEKL